MRPLAIQARHLSTRREKAERPDHRQRSGRRNIRSTVRSRLAAKLALAVTNQARGRKQDGLDLALTDRADQSETADGYIRKGSNQMGRNADERGTARYDVINDRDRSRSIDTVNLNTRRPAVILWFRALTLSCCSCLADSDDTMQAGQHFGSSAMPVQRLADDQSRPQRPRTQQAAARHWYEGDVRPQTLCKAALLLKVFGYPTCGVFDHARLTDEAVRLDRGSHIARPARQLILTANGVLQQRTEGEFRRERRHRVPESAETAELPGNRAASHRSGSERHDRASSTASEAPDHRPERV
ncbi:hypothetical protein Alvin_3247 (plasmid) [Allochromatium vinosum DSM 180]|uniref:Uncharacterized protein n=1 Tax=Allochromatium vinosum (strain ATCC 17899 / DSM 180 / NBRC 103801 / NCIMB 10441 / D) TaxID=572477 RepID=D3RWC6_ALLVD|nr:hypothetical protein Alvin_3247 [Allochromatium vinosum DSM 180]